MRARLRRAYWLLATLGLAIVLVTIAIGVTASRRQAEHQILLSLRAQGNLTAGFVSTFLSDQLERQSHSARWLLAGRHTSAAQFDLLVASFDSTAAVLLDRSGRLLQVAPRDPGILGSDIAPRYAHLRAAEAGRTAVSGVVPSAVAGQPIIALAVPYPTADGRRVLSLAYPVAKTLLAALLKHATVLTPHRVVLIDTTGKIIAGNPSLRGSTLSQADARLATAIAGHPQGSTRVAGVEARYVMVHVPRTSWRLVIAIPDGKLFASIDGSAHWLPWVVFVVLSVFGLLALALFARSLTTGRRLSAASEQLALAARTDTVTGLLNRRALEACLGQAAAHARRHLEPLSAMMIDVDHFKQFNDTHGHDTGDQILRLIADAMHTVFRESDMYGRWGGDEFLALLPATDRAGAETVSQRLREHAQAINPLPADVTQPITLCVGVATTTDATAAAADDLLHQADMSLYEVKNARDEPTIPLPSGSP